MQTERIEAPFWAFLLSAVLVLLAGVLLLSSYLNTHMDGEIRGFEESEDAFRAVAEYMLACGDAVYVYPMRMEPFPSIAVAEHSATAGIRPRCGWCMALKITTENRSI